MGRRLSERWRDARAVGCLGREGWLQIAAIYVHFKHRLRPLSFVSRLQPNHHRIPSPWASHAGYLFWTLVDRWVDSLTH